MKATDGERRELGVDKDGESGVSDRGPATTRSSSSENESGLVSFSGSSSSLTRTSADEESMPRDGWDGSGEGDRGREEPDDELDERELSESDDRREGIAGDKGWKIVYNVRMCRLSLFKTTLNKGRKS